MKKGKLLASLLCAGLILTGCSKEIPKLKNGEEIVASVDGKDFTATDLYTELKDQGGYSVLVDMIDNFIVSKELTDDQVKEAEDAADSYITNLKSQYEGQTTTFADALASAGYADEAAFRDLVVKQQKKTIVGKKYIQADITDKEIEAYYESDIAGDMTVKYILVQPEVADDATDEETATAEAAALKEAKEVITKLKSGDKFEDLAKKYSDDSTTADQGGLLSNFVKADVVEEFWNASVALTDGKYTTEPVKSSYGYFVILRVNQNEKPSLKDSKNDILDALYTEKTTADTELTSTIWATIREKYKLAINDTDLKNTYKDNN